MDGADDKCVECLQDNHCPPGEFCVRVDAAGKAGYPQNIKIGQCVPRAAPLGNKCDPTLTFGNVRLDENNLFYCGFISGYDDNDDAEDFQWEGECVLDGREHKCYECAEGDNGSTSFNQICARSLTNTGSSEATYTSQEGINFSASIQQRYQLLWMVLLGVIGVHAFLVKVQQ